MVSNLHVPEDGSLDPEHEEEEGQLQAATSMTRQPWARSDEVGIYKGTKYPLCIRSMALTVPKVIDFHKYNTKFSGENEVLTTKRNISCSTGISFSSSFPVISRII